MEIETGFKIIGIYLLVCAIGLASFALVINVSPTFIESVEVTNVNLIGNRIKLFTNSSISPIFTVQGDKISIVLMQELIDFDYENESCYLKVKWRIFVHNLGHDLLNIELLK